MTPTPVAPLPLTLGQQLHLAGDPHPWTVKAVSEHFAALTRSLRASDIEPGSGDESEQGWLAPLYTVLDWRNGVRGPRSLQLGQGAGTYTEVECAEMLAEFESGELEISHRNRVRIEFGEMAR